MQYAYNFISLNLCFDLKKNIFDILFANEMNKIHCKLKGNNLRCLQNGIWSDSKASIKFDNFFH